MSPKVTKLKAVDAIRSLKLPLNIRPTELFAEVKAAAAFNRWDNNRSLHGALYEHALCNYLEGHGVPVKMGETFNIKCVKVDIVAFPQEDYRVCISLKTSTRERWKQFEYEASIVRRHMGLKHCKYYAFAGGSFPREVYMPSVDFYGVWDQPAFDEKILDIIKQVKNERVLCNGGQQRWFD